MILKIHFFLSCVPLHCGITKKKNNALTEIITKKDEYSSFNLRYDTEERKYLGTLDIRYSFILLYTRC